jgi:hypothetical protein
MKTKKQLFLVLLSFLFGSNFIAQQNTVGAGGEASGSGGTVSFSVGQIDFSSQTGTTGSLSQGVQQPLEFFNVGLVENAKDFAVLLFPNPTVAELHVDMQGLSLDQLKYFLTDVNGKLILASDVTMDKITINMVDQSRGDYFLNFVRSGELVGSYKVVKN